LFNGMNFGSCNWGAIVGLVLVLISAFKPQLSLFSAGLRFIWRFIYRWYFGNFEAMYPGIVIQAVGATFVTFMVCLGLYKYSSKSNRTIQISCCGSYTSYCYLLHYFLVIFDVYKFCPCTLW
jgi:hypothetical protein